MKPLGNLKCACLVTLFWAGTHAANSQTVLAGWDMGPLPGGTNNYGPSPFTPLTVHSSVTVGGLTRGPGVGISGTGAAHAWGGTNWVASSLDSAVTAGDYATFTIQPKNGFTISISQIAAYNVRRSGTGPTTGQWQYSLDDTSFTNIGSAITWGDTTNKRGNPQSAIGLSGINDLQGVSHPTTVTFRVVNWGGTNSAGTWYLNDPEDDTANDFQVEASTILPVELVEFRANINADGSVALFWRTVSETNNDFFAVQRSGDGGRWQELVRVPGAGTTFSTTEYYWADKQPFPGINYYRLLQVDYDGQYQFSQIISVRLPQSQPEVIIYPSHFSDELHIRINTTENSTGRLDGKLLSINGVLMKEFFFENSRETLTIQVNELPVGAYLLNIKIGPNIRSNLVFKN